MKKLLILALLALPLAAYSQELSNAELEALPAAKGAKMEALESAEPVQRPDAQKIMSELSTALRLSSKQEERLTSAINKRMAQFDKLMKEYDKNSAEEKKWRYKMNANRYEMLKLNREMPDAIREFLDDDQRQSYDEMLLAGKTSSASVEQAAAGEEGAAKPVKKKRLVKRKKLPPPSAGPADEEAGQTMVDKEVQPAPRKMKKVLKKKPVLKPEPDEAEEPAGARPTGKEAALGEGTGTWFALTAPKGTPAPVLKYIHDAAKAAMEEPAFLTLMKSRGVDVDYKPGDKVRQELWKEHKEWGDLLRRLGMIKK